MLLVTTAETMLRARGVTDCTARLRDGVSLETTIRGLPINVGGKDLTEALEMLLARIEQLDAAERADERRHEVEEAG